MVKKKLKEGGGHAAQLARLGELKMVILQAFPLISLKVTRKRSESFVHGESLRVFRFQKLPRVPNHTTSQEPSPVSPTPMSRDPP